MCVEGGGCMWGGGGMGENAWEWGLGVGVNVGGGCGKMLQQRKESICITYHGIIFVIVI